MPRTEFIVFCPDCFFSPSILFSFHTNCAQASNLKFTVHVKLKPGLENFEHYFASMWDECNCMVVWAFLGIAFLWDCDENWPFPGLRLILSFTFFFVSKSNQSSLRDQSPKDGSNPSMSLHSLCQHQVQNIIIDLLDSHMALLSGVVFLNYKSDHATLLPKSSCGSPVPSEWSPYCGPHDRILILVTFSFFSYMGLWTSYCIPWNVLDPFLLEQLLILL